MALLFGMAWYGTAKKFGTGVDVKPGLRSLHLPCRAEKKLQPKF